MWFIGRYFRRERVGFDSTVILRLTFNLIFGDGTVFTLQNNTLSCLKQNKCDTDSSWDINMIIVG